MMRRSLVILLCFLAMAGAALGEILFSDSTYTPGETLFPMETQPQAEPPRSPEPVEILISATGDVTLGGNMRGNP